MKLSKQKRREQKKIAKLKKEEHKKEKLKTFLTGRMGVKDRHHIIPVSRNGDSSIENLLVMDMNRHRAFHFLFSTMTFLEVVKILVRCLRMKDHPDYDEAQELLNELEN